MADPGPGVRSGTATRGLAALLLVALLRPSVAAAKPPPPAEARVLLVEEVLEDPAPLPFDAMRVVGDALPEDLAGPGLAVERKGADLLVDARGDGKPKVRATPKRPVLVRAGAAATPILLWWDGERWLAGPAAVLAGRSGAATVQVLDATFGADGVPTAGWVRRGTGAFRPLLAANRFQEEDGWLEASVRRTGDAVSALLRRSPRAEGTSEDRWRGQRAVNRFRDAAGLEPLDLDEERCRAAQAHAEYIRRNPAEGPTHEEIPGRPGSSPEGAVAAAEGVMELTGDTALAVDRLSRTMLHRIPLLHEPSQRLGIGAVHDSAGRTPNGPPGYTVVWAGKACSTALLPVVVPAPGAVDVPLEVVEELPEPEGRPGHYAQPRGHPLSVSHLPPGAKVLRFALRRAKGGEVGGLVFTPESPIHSAHAHNQCSAYFLPGDRLEADTVYRAAFDADVGDRALRLSWSFRTAAR